MVINENGLLSAMKQAYNGSGYHVASGAMGTKKCMYIANYGYSWGVVIQQNHVPRKVLGLIAEHIGKLPEFEKAFRARKADDAQDEIYDVAVKPIVGMLEQTRKSGNQLLVKTKLTWDGRTVWQKIDDMSVMFLDPKLEGIAALKNRATVMVGDCLHVKGEISQVFIGKIRPSEADKPMVAHMEKILWK